MCILLILGSAAHSIYKSLSVQKSDTPGLKYRVDCPLEFLDLYFAKHGAC
jgi:hypothetical protein